MFLVLAIALLAADLPADFSLPKPRGPFLGSYDRAGLEVPRGTPTILTTYFYWYDAATNLHILDPDGSDALTDHPPTLEGFSYKNIAWHTQELMDMEAAGIDVLLPVYWGSPVGGESWSDEGLGVLAQARQKLLDAGRRSPAIGMFYDTSTLQHNPRHYHVDLRTRAGQTWFYGTIRDFFSQVPPEHRAHIDGRPLVVLYARDFAKGVDEHLFGAVREMFRRDFGRDLFLVKMPSWPGAADSQYQWGAALEPTFLDTVGIGPGYDHSAVPGRKPLVRQREDGRFYARAWEKLLAMDPKTRSWLVHLETWNEFHEGSEICATKEYGRQYIEQTRRHADTFHGCKQWEPEKPGNAAVRGLSVAWIDDASRREELHRAGRNHWDSYIGEIVDQLGMRARAVPPAILRDADRLAGFRTLLVGALGPEHFAGSTGANLRQWVGAGGTLIAFAADGIDSLAGLRRHGAIPQPDGEFSCAATFALADHPLTAEIHSTLVPEQRLLIFSGATPVAPAEALMLGRLYDSNGKDTGFAAITARTLGKGRVYYFAFSVPQTLWVLHQGRPVDRDYDGDQRLRRSDAIVIRPHAREVPYADEILFLLQNLIGTGGHPFVHQLPPRPEGTGAERIPDALFHWGGDDEGSADGIQLFASNWMKQHGLPYHINAMPRRDGTFGLSLADARRIWANGHEIALHYNFVDGYGPGAGFTREDVLEQAAAFRRHFGRDSICSVNHHTRWTGWVEPARWMLEAGGKADNTFVHASSPPGNPVNLLGFSFGTSFPFWFYDDATGNNRRLDFLELPITAYECGYIGKEKTDFDTIHKVVDVAAQHHLTMNMFYHPIYIAEFPACRRAIEELLRYLKARNLQALHFGSDELYHWWKARSETELREVEKTDQQLTFDVATAWPAGAIVKVPLGARTTAAATVNEIPSPALKIEKRYGQNWALIVVPAGRSRVNVALR